MSGVTTRAITDDTRPWVRSVVGKRWGSTRVVRPGRAYDDVSLLNGFVAEEDGKPLGVSLWAEDGDDMELVVLSSAVEDRGAGTATTSAVVEEARARGCHRVFLFTTNDNIRAIRFYQRRGWDLVALHRNAMDEVRRVKPDVPMVGDDDIPLRHMLELEIVLR